MVHASALNWKLFEAKLVIQGFPEWDPFGGAARIVLEQNKFSETVTPNTDWIWDARTLVALLLQSHAFPMVLIPIAWKTDTYTDPYTAMFYWFQLNPLKFKSQLIHKQKWN